MMRTALAAIVAAIGLIATSGFANGQELGAEDYFEMHAGSFIAFQKTPTGWVVIGNGVAADVKLEPKGPKEIVRFVFAHGPQDGATLTVWNGYAKRLLYKGGIALEGDTRFAPTSICPVRANLISIELWPQPLARVQLGELELVDDRGPAVCK